MRWRAIQPAVFGLAALSFLLPFANVSCSDGRAEVSPAPSEEMQGYEIVVGTRMKEGLETLEEGFAIEDSDIKLGGDPFAVLTLGAALAGVGLSFLRRPRQRATATLVAAGAGTTAAVLLGLTPMLRAYGVLTVEWKAGYWACLGLFVMATAVSYLAYRDARPPPYLRERPDAGSG